MRSIKELIEREHNLLEKFIGLQQTENELEYDLKEIKTSVELARTQWEKARDQLTNALQGE